MKEIKCPNCGKAISVDDADFASILGQVKNQAFDEELNGRLREMQQRMALEQQTQDLQREQAYRAELVRRDAAIKDREAEIIRLHKAKRPYVRRKPSSESRASPRSAWRWST